MNAFSFIDEHIKLTRRYFLRASVLGLAAIQAAALSLAGETPSGVPAKRVQPDKAGVRPEPYFTPAEDFRDVSRGKPLPHSLPAAK